MRPRERQETGEQDLSRSRLDRIIDLTHALVKLSRAINWRFLEAQFGSVYSPISFNALEILHGRRARAPGTTCRACRCRAAPVLCAGRQAGVDQASTLCPCPSVQARQQKPAQAQDLSGPRHPRHRATHRRGSRARRNLRPAAEPLPARAGARSTSARTQGLFPARAGR